MQSDSGSDPQIMWKSRPIRGALVVASVPEFFQLFLRPHIDMLSGLGLDVRVACSAKAEVIDDDMYVHVPFSRSPRDLRAHRASVTKLRDLYRSMLGDDDALLLHVHTPIAAALARFAIPKDLRDRVCVVYTAHGFHFLPGETNVFARLERVMAAKTDLFVVMNADDETSARELAARGSGDVLLIPGIGCQRLELRTPTPGTERDLAVVGVLETRKRPMLAIESFALLDESFTLTFYGSGPLEAELAERARELGLQDRVTLAGWTTDLQAVYNSHGCVVFLSSQEGLPMAVVEAVGSGLPVVAYPIRGVRDILQGLDIWTEPSSLDPADVAAAIEAAVQKPIDVGAAHERAATYSVPNAVAVHRAGILNLLQPTA